MIKFIQLKLKDHVSLRNAVNIFQGYAEKQIGVEGLTIKITTRDIRAENHEAIKRSLNGKWRKEVQKNLKAENLSVWRKRQAKETMRLCETESPILPNNNILRQAYYEGINEELGIQKNDWQDLIRTVEKMSLNPEYIGLIQDIGLRRFMFSIALELDCMPIKNTVV